MENIRKHLIGLNSTIRDSMLVLNTLGKDAILFLADQDYHLMGSLTDGDVRRGLLNGFSLEDPIARIIQPHPRFIRKGERDIQKVIEFREGNFRIIPILDKADRIVNIINFRQYRSYLPIDAVIMAGGRGQRLSPLTDTIPKPLLKVDDKCIIEHNIDRLALFGIDDFWISVGYLGEQIQEHLGDGTNRNVKINYVWEDKPNGTIGSVSRIDNFQHDYILVCNSDLITNLEYEHFFLEFLKQDADLAVVTIPYHVNIPYAVMETNNGDVVTFKEKPTYTYYSNGGIYLIKRSTIGILPKNMHWDATDFMQQLIADGKKVIAYNLTGYWIDIGNPEDYEKAKREFQHIKF